MYASAGNTIELAREADLVIGAVLIPGAAAPKLITRAQLSEMKAGAAIVDVAIDQGGCFETSRITNHDDPTFVKHGVTHYCVPNIAWEFQVQVSSVDYKDIYLHSIFCEKDSECIEPRYKSKHMAAI